MAWTLMRIVIFSVALLVGLLLGSGVTSYEPYDVAAQIGRDINEPQCERNDRNTFVLVQALQDRLVGER